MRKRRREVVTCHLCGCIWTAPRGLGRESYTSHYIDTHYDLEGERV